MFFRTAKIGRNGILEPKFLKDNYIAVSYSQGFLKLHDKVIKFDHEETITVPAWTKTRF